MSTTNATYQKINWGWLNDYNGYKFAPITFVENLYTSDGYPFIDKYNERLGEVQTTISTGTVNNARYLVNEENELFNTTEN